MYYSRKKVKFILILMIIKFTLTLPIKLSAYFIFRIIAKISLWQYRKWNQKIKPLLNDFESNNKEIKKYFSKCIKWLEFKIKVDEIEDKFNRSHSWFVFNEDVRKIYYNSTGKRFPID